MQLHCVYRDADEFHNENNKQKMSQGIALTDEDRHPWLVAIHTYIESLLVAKTTGIVACSALKQKHRDTLIYGDKTNQNLPNWCKDITFIYLKGTEETIRSRLIQRKGHFMPASLLQSQLATLEEPTEAENHITVSIDQSVDGIVNDILRYIHE
ncbi:probable gluconokinase isoform X2 [Physella acuta]|nr:probable gluconokinase isoform X2 [Physella acuta]XP_059174632.1 probable gluconokinase isoform X2 [Physella acuta]XP_059174633.1 probable gluconokinase isoform X2 [Physella acuta]